MNLDVRTIVELSTLLGGIIVSVVGSLNAIRSRRHEDAALEATEGADRVSHARVAGNMVGMDPGYLAQIQRNFEATEARLNQAERMLRQYGVIKDQPQQPPQGRLPGF